MNMIMITTAALFLVAICSQIFLYKLSKRREALKEYKQINQELVLPYLNEVILYIEMKTDHRKDYGVEAITVNSDEVIAKIKEKISYSNAKLMNALYRYYNAIAYFEINGEAKNLATFEVFFQYLHHAHNSLEKSKYDDEYLLDIVAKNQKVYGIMFVLTTILGKEEAMKILSYNWIWTPKFLDKISVELLEDLIENYHMAKMEEHKLLTFLSTLKSSFVDTNEIEPVTHLKEYIEEAIVIVKDRYVNYSQ